MKELNDLLVGIADGTPKHRNCPEPQETGDFRLEVAGPAKKEKEEVKNPRKRKAPEDEEGKHDKKL